MLSFKNHLKAIVLTTLLMHITGCNNQSNSNEAGAESPEKVDIHGAVISGDIQAVKQYIQQGSDLDHPDPFGGSSPLITAALFSKREIVTLLLEAGAKVNFTNNEGSTALHTAAFFCETEIVRILLTNGADKTVKNNYGSTPLMSVAGSFDEVKGIYIMMEKQLSPMGFTLDLNSIQQTRPVIAKLLQ